MKIQKKNSDRPGLQLIVQMVVAYPPAGGCGRPLPGGCGRHLCRWLRQTGSAKKRTSGYVVVIICRLCEICCVVKICCVGNFTYKRSCWRGNTFSHTQTPFPLEGRRDCRYIPLVRDKRERLTWNGPRRARMSYYLQIN